MRGLTDKNGGILRHEQKVDRIVKMCSIDSGFAV